jgi:hypothetical protein
MTKLNDTPGVALPAIPPETIALAAGATVRDGESITFSVEAWRKFIDALGVLGTHETKENGNA